MNNFANGECTQQQCLPGGRVGIVPAANVSVEVLLQVASLVLPVNGSARIISLVGMNDSRIDGTHNIRRRNLITTCQACCSSAAQSRSCFRKLQIQSTLHGPIGPLRGRSSTAPSTGWSLEPAVIPTSGVHATPTQLFSKTFGQK